MKALAALAHGAWLAGNLPAWLRFRRALEHPAEAQARILHRLLAADASSAYGRAHGFADIRNYEQFRERVPAVEDEALSPWIERIRRGEPGVLTAAPVTRLVPTSGSSAARKLIPFTAALQGEFQAGIGPWMVDLCRQHPGLVGGPAYWSISPAMRSEGQMSAVPIGFDDDSAYLGGLRQRLVQATMAVPSAVRLARDWEDSRYLTLLCLLRQPELRFVSVWHPSFLTLLLEDLPRAWHELLRDVEQGGCRRAGALPAPVRAAVAGPPMAGRANQLRRADPFAVQSIWPRWRVASCWGDGPAGLAWRELQRRVPHVALQPKGLLATEGVVTIPFQGRHPVAVRSHFYEFADAAGAVHPVHDLRPGEIYTVLLTTGGGLWRYRLGDEVEVDGRVGGTPSLRFLGRGGAVSDLTGEKLHESFVTVALERALVRCGWSTPFAVLAPDVPAEGAPRYVLWAEGDAPAELPRVLEEELCRNPHFDLCRRLGQLAPVTVGSLARGAYEAYCRAETVGQPVGAIKPRSLLVRPTKGVRTNEGR